MTERKIAGQAEQYIKADSKQAEDSKLLQKVRVTSANQFSPQRRCQYYRDKD